MSLKVVSSNLSKGKSFFTNDNKVTESMTMVAPSGEQIKSLKSYISVKKLLLYYHKKMWRWKKSSLLFNPPAGQILFGSKCGSIITSAKVVVFRWRFWTPPCRLFTAAAGQKSDPKKTILTLYKNVETLFRNKRVMLWEIVQWMEICFKISHYKFWIQKHI